MPRSSSPRNILPLLAVLITATPVVFAAGGSVEPDAQELADLKNIRGTGGVIVWHSNRDGDFEIFRMNADGTGKKQLTHNDRKDHFARWSPDGNRIAFTSERNFKPQVFIMNPDGSGQRIIIDNAEMSSWLPGGGGIVWSKKDLSSVFVRDLATGKDREILPANVPELQRKRVGYASFSSNLLHLTFYSNWRGYHSANLMEADGTGLRMVGKGCEPSWYPDGKHVVHVKAGAKIYSNNLSCDDYRPVTDIPRGKGRRDHEYFPSISNDGEYLVWGICPWNQHNHWTSDYEIFIMRLPDGKAVRLTFHSATDAWPHLFRQVKPPSEWEGLEAQPGWEVITWADPVEIRSTVIHKKDKEDTVITITAMTADGQGQKGKVAIGADLHRDLVTLGNVEIELDNPAATGASIAVAFRTGPGNTYFESVPVKLDKGTCSFNIPVASGRFKCEASGWKFREKPPSRLDDTRRVIVLLYGLPKKASVILKTIHLR